MSIKTEKRRLPMGWKTAVQLHHCIQTGSCAHLVRYHTRTKAYFLGIKVDGACKWPPIS